MSLKATAVLHPLQNPFQGTVIIPGSKSYTNRALIIASLAKGTSVLHGCSNSNDSLLLIENLKKLGVELTSDRIPHSYGDEEPGNEIKVKGNGGKFKEFNGKLYARDAGSVMRFLTALCCLIPGEILLKGSSRMYRRPIKPLVDVLRKLGAKITYLGKEGFPPLKIKGGMLTGGKAEIDSSQSSQFISALLMIAPLLESDLEIVATNELVSAPYIKMSIETMKHFGVTVEQNGQDRYFVKKQQAYLPTEYRVEADASSATYLFGFAAITQSSVRVENLPPLSLQADIRFADLLKKMGCKVKMDADKNWIEVTGVKELKAIEADMKDMPDAVPALAVIASFTKGTTIMRGVKNLELKESGRLTALRKELTKMGIDCQSDGEQIVIQGGNPKGAFIKTYNDHRIAMAFAMAGARTTDVIIQEPLIVWKSFPAFWDTLRRIGVEVDFTIELFPILPNLVLIGFMGSGKSAIGKLLAKKIPRLFYETDKLILHHSGLNSINEIFDKKGEPFYRELEKKAVEKYSRKNRSIISCGGGVVTEPENMKLLKEHGQVVYLSASFETLCERLKDDTSRPLFRNKEKAKELYQQRLPLYGRYADYVVYTDNLTPDEVASNIEFQTRIKFTVQNPRTS